MRHLPSGTLTLLFTDIEGSTALLREGEAAFDQTWAQVETSETDALVQQHLNELE
jgi:hypothetical protein